jgi:hypothetical protein
VIFLEWLVWSASQDFDTKILSAWRKHWPFLWAPLIGRMDPPLGMADYRTRVNVLRGVDGTAGRKLP